jgi:quinoprotein glucose dehydrogenase
MRFKAPFLPLLCGLLALQGLALLTSTPRFSVLAIAAQQPTTSSRSVRDGVYNAGQAKRGEEQYQLDCSTCHGVMLTGGESGSALIGSDFIADWAGKTMADLFEYTQGGMPKDSPGRLSRQQYANLIAYILSANQFPAGEQELKSDAESLRQIRFEAPQN